MHCRSFVRGSFLDLGHFLGLVEVAGGGSGRALRSCACLPVALFVLTILLHLTYLHLHLCLAPANTWLVICSLESWLEVKTQGVRVDLGEAVPAIIMSQMFLLPRLPLAPHQTMPLLTPLTHIVLLVISWLVMILLDVTGVTAGFVLPACVLVSLIS